jgi:Icc protein
VETRYLEDATPLPRSAHLDRRSFLKVSTGAVAAAVAAGASNHFHSFLPINVAYAGEGGGTRFHLRVHLRLAPVHQEEQRTLRTRSCCARGRRQPLDPQPDFVFYGGDLAQLGRKEELDLGAQILKSVKAPLHMMVGEHDWFSTWDIVGTNCSAPKTTASITRACTSSCS